MRQKGGHVSPRRTAWPSKPNWGNLACALLLLWFTTVVTSHAQTFTTLYSFSDADGCLPSGLIQATDGSLYGTTYGGGRGILGTIFRITPSGTLTTLHSFDGSVGSQPYAGLVQATNGNLYGTTVAGGANGYGTVFKISPSGKLTNLHSFDFTDGAFPYAGVVQATNGNLYGTTEGGGANADGTVFEITLGGTLTTLYTFCPQNICTTGADPVAGLVEAIDGNLYGSTIAGGANGYGTVFKITPSGKLTNLHSFDFTDGESPLAALIQANGNLYGTADGGGPNGLGTVFKITPSGTLTTLHNFDGTDGSSPSAGLVLATDGNFYGMTGNGGVADLGTIFKITRTGTLTTLYSFCSQSGCPDGSNPSATLNQDTNGNLYGTTLKGGANACGTIFSLSVGLGPFVETQTTSGKVGASVKILGTNLTGVTSVTFNGTSAAFNVVSRSEITTIVPSRATTGIVQVVTPGGTLSSNTNFRVIP